MKIKKGDTVKIIKGKDKGKTGKVERTFARVDKVLVEGVNQFKRHVKGRVQGQKSDIVSITKPLPVSNVTLLCPNCKKASRIGFIVKENSKYRICKRCEEKI